MPPKPTSIVIISGFMAGSEIRLEKESLTIGRSDDEVKWRPDIDLSPDFKVSREHARLFHEKGRWWIEDTNSKHGTLFDGREIKGLPEPCELKPGVAVTMGSTIWILRLPDDVYLKKGNLSLGFKRIRALNYALYHCGIPTVSGLVIRNHGDAAMPPFSLSMAIKGYSRTWHRHFDSLPPKGEITQDLVRLDLDYEKLEGQEGRRTAQLEVRFNNEVLATEEIRILGFFEWPIGQGSRKSLACFVQPAHPVVQNLVLDATAYLENATNIHSFFHLSRADLIDRAEVALKALYECLKERYTIHYVLEPPSYEEEYQVIRPPHRVICETGKFRGEGTCIDLTLLMAACLENIRFQPLLIFVKEKGPYQHAFLGCWKQQGVRFRPIITDFRNLDPNELVMVETTGLTDRWQRKLDYPDAVRKAAECFREDRFQFALDIAATRNDVVPLQFPMDPGALKVLREAEASARKHHHPKLETKHLFLSILLDSESEMKAIVEAAGGKVSRSLLDQIACEMLGGTNAQPAGGSPRPTINYRRIIEDARLVAGDAGYKFAERSHLLYAILLSQSGSVDLILEKIGTGRQRVRNEFEAHFPWTRNVVQTYFEI